MNAPESKQPIERSRIIRRLILGLLVSIPVLGALIIVFDVQWSDLALLDPDPLWLLLATLSYIPCMLVRAHRMMHLENTERAQSIGYGPMVWILCIHQAANHVLPMRTGEATYAALLKARSGRSAGRSVGVTLLMRSGDLLGLGFVVLCATPLVTFATLGGEMILYLGGAFSLVLGLSCLIWGHHLIGMLTAPFVRIMPERVKKSRQSMLEALSELRTSASAIVTTIWTSVVLWGLIMLMHWLLGKGLGIDLSIAEMTIAAAGGVVMSMAPISSALNLGTVEAGWIGSLALLGVAPEVAFPIGLGVHLGLILATCLFGLIGGWVLMRATNSAEIAKSPEG